MTDEQPDTSPEERGGATRRFPAFEAPFGHAPETARTVFLVTLSAASAPLLAGVLLFGWRAAVVAGVSIASCAVIERVYYRVTRTPALLGRTHAYLTGVLLALTLPAFVPWYVPVVAAAFAVILGKAVFGGVGHFLWQPALVGRLAVAVIFAGPLTGNAIDPDGWGVLARSRLLIGDVREVRTVDDYRGWRRRRAPAGADGFRLQHPRRSLAKLTRGLGGEEGRQGEAAYSGLATARRDIPHASPPALRAPPPDRLPPVADLLLGATPGGIGQTCTIVIVVAGLYLVYRNYVRWQLPVSILLSAAAVAAIAPVRLEGPNATTDLVWFPLLIEGLDVGFTYVCYQLLVGGLVLAAFFLAPEMTSRPVTAGGQVVFGVGCGAVAMILQLYVDVAIPAYMGVLAMNTFTPVIDAMWRPRVFGRPRLAFLRRRR
jgi:electron transport complex protein RnfD